MKKIRHIIQASVLAIIPLALMGATFKASEPITKAAALSGAGTSEDPIIISTSAELEEVMSNVNSGTDDYKDKYLTITNDLSISLVKTTNSKTFRGNLDGGNHTITLSTSATGDEVAMFNCVGSVAHVSNIVFAGNISGVGAKSSTLCSWNYGIIDNIINNCQLTSTNTVGYLGGIAASQIAATASITNCVNNADISGNIYVGGIVGNLRVGTIADSINKGDVNVTSTAGAGIAGLIGAKDSEFDAKITNCINEGNISGVGQVAGIAGGIYPKLTCTNCSNYGDITASGNSGAGGIAGYISSTLSSAVFSFTDCYSSGTVTTNKGWAGGLFGYVGSSSSSSGTVNFTNVLSAAKVVDTSTTGNIGGFMAGQNSATVSFNLVKCQSMASISYSGNNAFSTGIALSKTKIVTNEDSSLAVNDKDRGTELSDTTIKLLRAIREFDCAYDATMATIVSNGVSNLTPNEIDVLDLTVHFGKDGYMNSYYNSAVYINGFMSNNVNGLNRINLGTMLNNNVTLIVIGVSALAISGLVLLLLLRRRKRA